MDRKGRQIKYALLGLIAVLVLTTGRTDYGNYETYLTLFSFHGNLFSWSLVAVMLLAAIRVERFWCRYLCPVAALTGVLSRKAPGYPGRNGLPHGERNKPGNCRVHPLQQMLSPECRGEGMKDEKKFKTLIASAVILVLLVLSYAVLEDTVLPGH